jgi:hypothetical protein
MKPSLFKNTNINPIDNNKKQTIVKEINIDIEEVLNKIFKEKYPFNTKVLLKTKTKEIETYLIKRNDKEIITLDEETIPINEIINIIIKKKDFF